MNSIIVFVFQFDMLPFIILLLIKDKFMAVWRSSFLDIVIDDDHDINSSVDRASDSYTAVPHIGFYGWGNCL